MNVIIIYGRLGRDPELKEYKNAKGEPGQLCNFSVAVDKSKDDAPTWFDVTAFGRTAQRVYEYKRKGDEIIVIGSMESRTYEDKNGQKRTAWSLKADRVKFCGPRGDKSGGDPLGWAKGQAEAVPDSFEDAEEDIPF